MKKNLILVIIISFVLAIALAVTAFFLGIKIGEDSAKNTTESFKAEGVKDVVSQNNNTTPEYTSVENTSAENVSSEETKIEIVTEKVTKTEVASTEAITEKVTAPEKFNEALARKLINQYISACEANNVEQFINLFCLFTPQAYLDIEHTDLASYMKYSLSKEYTITSVSPDQEFLGEINRFYKKYGFNDIVVSEGYEVTVKEDDTHGREFFFVKENGNWKIASLGFWSKEIVGESQVAG